MLTKLLHRLYGIVIIGCILLCPVLSGCDDDTVNGFLQFSDDNLLLRAAGGYHRMYIAMSCIIRM